MCVRVYVEKKKNSTTFCTVHAAKLLGWGQKGETKLAILAATATGLHFYFLQRLNARLDEAHLLIPSEKVLQKNDC